MPTPTAYPTLTQYPTNTTVPATATPKSGKLAWAELIDFILNDHTNWNTYSDIYNCVNFSIDLVSGARQKGIQAWIVSVSFVGKTIGHSFVAFPTKDRGEIWIEPQSDEAYTISQVGQPLCLANNPNLCWDQGIISQIIEPAECDPVTHECWQGNQ